MVLVVGGGAAPLSTQESPSYLSKGLRVTSSQYLHVVVRGIMSRERQKVSKNHHLYRCGTANRHDFTIEIVQRASLNAEEGST